MSDSLKVENVDFSKYQDKRKELAKMIKLLKEIVNKYSKRL